MCFFCNFLMFKLGHRLWGFVFKTWVVLKVLLRDSRKWNIETKYPIAKLITLFLHRPTRAICRFHIFWIWLHVDMEFAIDTWLGLMSQLRTNEILNWPLSDRIFHFYIIIAPRSPKRLNKEVFSSACNTQIKISETLCLLLNFSRRWQYMYLYVTCT